MKPRICNTKENEVEKEDLAGQNIFLMVALCCVRQLRPHATDSTTRFKDLVGGGWGWGYFVDFFAEQITEFCLIRGQYGWCNNTIVF